jgi:carbon-monoxide dehydrogenase medium subunit
LMPGEILEAIKTPRLSGCGRCGYYKVCRKAGDFASALGAILYDPERSRFRAVIGATHGKPIVIPDAQQLMKNECALNEDAVLALLAQHNISDLTSRRQQAAALARAYRQARPH